MLDDGRAGRLSASGDAAGRHRSWPACVVLAAATGAVVALLGPMWAVLGAAFAAGAWFAAVHPEAGLALAVLTVPLGQLEIDLGAVQATPTQMIAGILSLALVGRYFFDPTFRWRPSPLHLPVLALFAYHIVSAAVSLDPEVASRRIVILLSLAFVYMLVYITTAIYARTVRSAYVLGAMIAVTGAVLGLQAIYGYVGGATTDAYVLESTVRIRLGFVHPNAMASFLILALAITASLWAWVRPYWRVVVFAAMAVMVLALGLTFSRGAWAGLAVAGIVLGFRRQLRFPVALLALATALFLALAPAVQERLISSLDPSEPARAIRPVIYGVALKLIRENPLTGVGAFRFPEAYSASGAALLHVAGEGPVPAYHAHNLFLQYAAELGLLGLALLLWVLAAVVIATRRSGSNDPAAQPIVRAALAGVLGVVTHQLVDYTLGESLVGYAFWITLGMLAGLTSRSSPAARGSDPTPRPVLSAAKRPT